MTQAANYSVPLIGPVSPTTMAQRIDDSFQAMLTQNRGATRPVYAQPGTLWIDAAVNTAWKLNMWDGVDDNMLLSVNVNTGAVTLPVVTIGNATADGHALNRVTADNRYAQLAGAAFTGPVTFSVAATVSYAGAVTYNAQATFNSTMVASNRFDMSRDSADSFRINRSGSDGSIAIWQKAGTTVGSISITSTNTNYATTSDKRLKDDPTPLGDVSAIIDALEPVSYRWNHVPGDLTGVGFLAQDLHQVVPAAVAVGDSRPDGPPGDEDFIGWGVDASALIPYLVAEIKNLRTRVAALEGLQA
jgi:hypothetical protein